MSNNIRNIKRSINNTVHAVTSTVAVGTEVIADSSELIANSIGATPTVLKALLSTPFSAAKGYLMEAEGLSEEQAQAAAFHYLEQDFATTVEQAGEGAGKLVAKLFEDMDSDVDTDSKETNKVA